jgi:subtilase family serine protease
VRWAPEGEEAIPVEWDLPGLSAGEEKELSYTWIPARTGDSVRTIAVVDANDDVVEIEEAAANSLEQVVTVLEP